ncbi:MAG: sugar phosphate isomerase/epimerase [Clostridia bacterium]|nr:sugar phosphate isomerase/epimerase [Clostridia bacterium]
MSELILSAFADEYADSFIGQLEALNDLGIGWIEPRFLDKINVADLSPAQAKGAKNLLDQFGIRVSSMGSPLGKITLDDDMDDHLEKARRVFETANLFETKFVRFFSFYPGKGQEIAKERETVLDRVGRLAELAGTYGLTLCHENEANIYGESDDACLDLLESFGGRLKCVFDMGNFVLGGIKPLSAFEKLAPHIAYFHIKDALAAGAIVPPGCGEANIPEILGAYKRMMKEDTFVSLEPHLETFSGLNSLVGKTFENPYRFPDKETAFRTAAGNMKDILAKL